jgi:hypothetical protein
MLMAACLVAVINGAWPFAVRSADDAAAVRSDRDPPDSDPDAKFADGWRKTVVLSDQNAEGQASKCIAWVDQGWLLVERRDVGGDLEWQIVLAQVGEEDEPPKIEAKPRVANLVLDISGGLRLDYRDGLFFIHDDRGRLRCLRQKKSAAVKWPVLAIPPNEPQPGGGTMGRRDHIYYYRTNHRWQFIARGLGGELAEYVLRMYCLDVGGHHLSAHDDGSGVDDITVGAPYGLIRSSTLWDDGELLVVRRMDGAAAAWHRAEQEKLAANRKQLVGAAPPKISAREWLNSPRPIAIGDLRGRAELVYFTGEYSGQIAEQLSALTALHEKYRDRGLTVVVVATSNPEFYSAQAKDLKFALALSDYRTAERFFVTDKPSYLLIGRDGKIAGSQYQERLGGAPPALPSGAEIEKLLKAEQR